MVIKIDLTDNLGLVVTRAEKHVAAVNGSIFIKGVAVFNVHFGAVILLIEFDVHNTSHRIRSVGAGSAVLQDLDGVDGRTRDAVQIDERRSPSLPCWVGRDTLAVNQHQGCARIKSTQ